MINKVTELLDKPSFSLLGLAATNLTAIITDSASILTLITQLCGAGTAFLIFMWWLRKFLIQGLHDIKCFKKRRLPPINTETP